MLFRIKSYLQFLWYSKNEHGVHSPFVFFLLTKCFYNNALKLPLESLSQYKNERQMQLLYKIVRYFEPQSILFNGDPNALAKTVLALASAHKIIDTKIHLDCYACVYFNLKNTTAITDEFIKKLLETTENDSFWIFENIHSTATQEAFWQKIKSNSNVTVTLDTYSLGLVFFRREQEKEHFVIRA